MLDAAVSVRSPISFLLFDLGGVLVRWEGAESLPALSRRVLTAEESRRFWLESPAVRCFETGRCTAEEFARRVVGELDLRVDAMEFLVAFAGWDQGPLPGALELLQELGRSFELGCLSNNNELHWRRLREKWGLDRYFRHCFVSCEIGRMKPDPAAFEYVLSRLSFPASAVVFFDDNPECVEAAGRLGFRAFQVRGVAGVRDCLKALFPPG